MKGSTVFHISANFVALANTANTEVPALQDQVLPIRSGRHTPYEDMYGIFFYASGVTLLRSRINTPQVRKVTPSFIVPVQAALLPVTNPNVMDTLGNPFLFRKDEGILYESTDSAAGPNNHYVIAGLMNQATPRPSGTVYTIRGSSTTAAVASVWTPLSMVWDADLTEGIYAVIGGEYIAANAIAFSLAFENQVYRPGGLGMASANLRPVKEQLDGSWGEWGRFRSLNPPIVNVLNDGTDASHIIHLKVVRIGGSPLT